MPLRGLLFGVGLRGYGLLRGWRLRNYALCFLMNWLGRHFCLHLLMNNRFAPKKSFKLVHTFPKSPDSSASRLARKPGDGMKKPAEVSLGGSC